MIPDLKPYPAYKDSGVEWLGDVPEHWVVKRNKLFMREVNERSEDGSEELLTVSQYTGVTRRRERLSDEGDLLTNAASLVGYKRVKPGDLVMNIMLAWNGSLGVSYVDGIASPAYCVFRAKDGVDPRFLHYLLRTPLFTGAFKTVSTGVVDSRLRLYPDVFFRLPSPLPPLPEQTAIVRYLDYMDRRIGRYIRAKKRLVALFNEQKQAIIHRAVTRGLDPNVRLKPSGVEWLGDVPEHWELRRLKTLSWMRSGESITSLSIEPTGTYPVYGGNGIRGYAAEFTHEGEYALIGRQGALCGNVHLAHGRFWASEHAVVASLDTGFDLEWFAAILMVMNLNQYSMAAAQPGIAVERVLNLWIPVPPADDQRRIAENIKRATEGIVATASSAQREIDLLREYRTRLIADVVTGKVDVREAAARLPEEEAEWEDESPEEGEMDAAGLDESEGGAHEEQ